MSNREKSDDIAGVEFAGVESVGVESAGSEWAGVGGRPTLSPALDLQFALDKTLTARKGPTPVFVRGSGATFVDSDGLVKYGPENTILQSEDFGTFWSPDSGIIAVSTNVITSPSGLINADKITENTTTTARRICIGSFVPTAGTVYTFSCYLKAEERNIAQLGFGGVFGNQYQNFIIGGASAGTLGNSLGVTSPQITALANGWYRCTATITSAGSGATQVTVGPLNADTALRWPTYVGTIGSGIYAWGAQVERSSTARTYIPTTTAAVYGPRFDHDPFTGVCKGLLIEEARTNNAWYSGAIVGGTGWLITETTSVVDGLGPDNNNAYTITETVATTTHSIGNTGGPTASGLTSIVNGTTYTGSIFIKKVTGSVDWIQLTLAAGGFGGAQYANFNIGTGVVGNSAGLASGTSPRIEDYGNGWYRCSISATATTTTTTSFNLFLALINNTNGTTRAPIYAGSTANKVLASLCQFETGAFATSYIPTTSASVVRSADVCSITGSDFSGFYNQTEGSLACNYAITTGFTGNRYAASIEDATGGTQNGFVFRNTNVAAMFIAGGGPSSTIGAVSTGASKHILVYSGLSEFVYVKDSVVGTTTGSGTRDPSLPIRMSIGSLEGSNAFTLCGHISSIRYFKKRLPNAKLQAITV